eukprot:m51a1_g7921 hypothetical protein (637) ;mRNA; f:1124-4017
MRLKVVLSQRALATSELLCGVVRVHATRSSLVHYTTTEHYTTRSNGQTHSHTRTVHHYPRETFFSSPWFGCYDELHASDSAAATELTEGDHLFPFCVRLPEALPTSFVSRSGNEWLSYFARATVRLASGSSETSGECAFAVVASGALPPPQGAHWECSKSGLSIQLEAPSAVPLGATTRAVLSMANNTSHSINKTVVTLLGHHQYRNGVFRLQYSSTTLPELKPGCSLNNTLDMPMPQEAMPNAQVGKLNWQHVIHVEAYTGLFRFNVHLHAPVVVVAPVTTPPAVLAAFSSVLRAPRDFSVPWVFMGAHTRYPLQYRRPQTLLAGFEEAATLSGAKLVVDHVARTAIAAPGQPGAAEGSAYPNWQSAVLPPGWTVGSDQGETFFVNHVEGYTSWVDPRPPHQRATPASRLARPVLDITALRGAGLIKMDTFGKSDPFCYVLQWRQPDKKPEKIKTEVRKKTLDPVWEANNVMRVEYNLRTRTNVVVYINDKDLLWNDFMGCVDIDLTYLPANVVIEQWFPVSNGKDTGAAVSGDILLRLHLHDLDAPAMDKCPHVVVNSTSSFIVPWHPMTKGQIKRKTKEEKKREKEAEKARQQHAAAPLPAASEETMASVPAPPYPGARPYALGDVPSAPPPR